MHSPPPISGSASGQGFVESDETSGHKKDVHTMLTMTGFMNSHALNKIPVFSNCPTRCNCIQFITFL